MKRLLIVASLALAACTNATGPQAPGGTPASEAPAEPVYLRLFRAARLAATAAIEGGLIRGELAQRLRALDASAEVAVQAATAARASGDATAYAVALNAAFTAIGDVSALIALARR